MSSTARLALLGAVLLVSLLAVPPAFAAGQPGAQRLSYRAGPYHVGPGQNKIEFAPTAQKPQVDGYIVGIRPNLRHADGSIPKTNRIMFHHGVWVNLKGKDATSAGPERFYAAGEEKTSLRLPKGYGYAYKASDPWILNYMIHNLVARPDDVYITYDIDFVPASSPAAAAIKPARPVWMDVENGRLYPVFDVFKGSGRKGRFTYPTQNPSAYAGRPNRPNRWRVDRDSVLIQTAGHLHAGGLWNDLYVTRQGKRDQSLLHVDERIDTRNRAYYWLGFKRENSNPAVGTDLRAVSERRISVTPLHMNLTQIEALEALRLALDGDADG